MGPAPSSRSPGLGKPAGSMIEAAGYSVAPVNRIRM
jgi:hypothetical protein